ncbi:trypsin 3A1-like [Oratosquilla oratoria]|uniref:trypsin 3A1-like n=1 Tax=Oratosquilla oratoria TaxID=337810 RepID=UPI003F75E7FD
MVDHVHTQKLTYIHVWLSICIVLSAAGCGKSVVSPDRIAGGDAVNIEMFPWQASLRDSFHGFKHFCGGSLIKPRWVLTAASCFLNRPKKGQLFASRSTYSYFGITKLGEEDGAIVKQTKRKHHYFHPQFNSKTYEYNVALLRIIEMVKLDEFPLPVCLGDQYDYRVGDSAITTGYGVTSVVPPSDSRDLMMINTKIQNDDLCKVALNDTEKQFHPHTQLCTYSRRRSACQKDEGGPLVVYSKGRYIQIGIVSSWPELCADERSKPSIYTQVSRVSDWIRRKTERAPCRYV